VRPDTGVWLPGHPQYFGMAFCDTTPQASPRTLCAYVWTSCKMGTAAIPLACACARCTMSGVLCAYAWASYKMLHCKVLLQALHL
jgi:hypothetical protein